MTAAPIHEITPFLLTRLSRGVTRYRQLNSSQKVFLLTRLSRGVTREKYKDYNSLKFLLTRLSRGVTICHLAYA